MRPGPLFGLLIQFPGASRGLECSIHVCQGSSAEGVKGKFNGLLINGANVMNDFYAKFLTSLALSIISPYVYAYNDNIEFPCSEEMKNKHGCNQCFNAGFLYENQSMPLAEVIHNTGGLEINYYENEFVMPTINNKGNKVVTFHVPTFELADEFTKDRVFDNGKGEKYVLLKPGESARWIKTKKGYDLGFRSIDKSLINSANLEDIRDRNFTVVYTNRPRYWDDKSKKYSPTGSQKHVTCQTIGAHFCGDGILDKDKEICDPRDPNKVNWTANGCSTDCRASKALVEGKRTPEGASTVPIGVRHEGDSVDNKMTRKGIYTYNGTRYEGDFVGNKMTGKGILTFPDGDRYEGDFVDGVRNGKGTYTFKSGTRYDGDFVDGKWSGKGILTRSDGSRYEGDFVGDKIAGKGTETLKSGIRYDGDFVDGHWSGKGIMTRPDGLRYEGDFVDTKMMGKGILTFANGERYEGDFVDMKRTGKGILTFPDGLRYKGDFIDGKPNGKGVYTWSNGNKYAGDFVDGESKNAGVYTLADGSRLEGEFADWRTGRLHGFGSRISEKGAVVEKGWFDGGFVIACSSSADCKQRIEKRQVEERRKAELEQARLEKRQAEERRKAAVVEEREAAQVCNRYHINYVGNIQFTEEVQGLIFKRTEHKYGGFIVIAVHNGIVTIKGVDNGRWRGGGNYPHLEEHLRESCTSLRRKEG